MTDNTFERYKLLVDGWCTNGFNSISQNYYGSKYYVYLLINSLDNKVFYIGKGKGKRAEHHLKEYRQKRIVNSKKYSVIKDIISNGGDVLIHVVKNNINEDAALRLERILIDSNKESITNYQGGTLSKSETLILIAREELSKIMPFRKWLDKTNPSSEHADIYIQNVVFLNDIISGKIQYTN